MRKVFLGWMLLAVVMAHAQVPKKIAAAMDVFNDDPQLKHALISLFVIDGATGEVVFDQNSKIGMATASTEKIITAATAFDVLGTDYSYKTKFGIINSPGGKSLYILPSGDPTLASWRWDDTKEAVFLNKLKTAVAASKVTNLHSIIIYTGDFGNQVIPDGWIWEDLGNYYGAGSQAINWRENQFDVILKSGTNLGNPVAVVRTDPYLYDYRITSQATAADKTSADNSIIYYPSMGNKNAIIKGTIPAGKTDFVVSGSIYDPLNQFVKTIANNLKTVVNIENDNVITTSVQDKNVKWIYTNESPSLSNVTYWFLRKSINLYGEALLKTLGLQQRGKASADNGIAVIKDHWYNQGIDTNELNIYDGSGLSPMNRVTTRAQVAVLKYAQQQSWFPEYYEAFPFYNDMKMKSGTINSVKGYTGYQKSKAGKSYIFSFLVNNYNGSQYALIRKMYKVLDELK